MPGSSDAVLVVPPAAAARAGGPRILSSPYELDCLVPTSRRQSTAKRVLSYNGRTPSSARRTTGIDGRRPISPSRRHRVPPDWRPRWAILPLGKGGGGGFAHGQLSSCSNEQHTLGAIATTVPGRRHGEEARSGPWAREGGRPGRNDGGRLYPDDHAHRQSPSSRGTCQGVGRSHPPGLERPSGQPALCRRRRASRTKATRRVRRVELADSNKATAPVACRATPVVPRYASCAPDRRRRWWRQWKRWEGR
jgi:hypothetical protein